MFESPPVGGSLLFCTISVVPELINTSHTPSSVLKYIEGVQPSLKKENQKNHQRTSSATLAIVMHDNEAAYVGEVKWKTELILISVVAI